MIKRYFSVLLIVLIAVPAALHTANAAPDVSSLRSCRKLYSYSGSSHAYFYGFENRAAYSAEVLPGGVSRSISVDGVIRAVCHDEHSLHALYETNGKYRVASLNMSSGKLTDDSLDARSDKVLYFSFAADGKSAFLIINGGTYSKVVRYARGGKQLQSYSMPDGAECVFVNGGKSYAKSYSGEIFELTDSGRIKRAELSRYKEFSNAGVGLIYSEDGELISLLNGSTRRESGAFCVQTDRDIFRCGSGKLFAAVGASSATLSDSWQLSYQTLESAVSETPQKSQTSGGQTQRTQTRSYPKLPLHNKTVLIEKAGITVTKLKKQYPQITAVFDGSGRNITSGIIKTCYSLRADNRDYPIAVKGDVSCNGKVNSTDLREVMKAILNIVTLNTVKSTAADINSDGIIDTRDVALLAQMY